MEREKNELSFDTIYVILSTLREILERPKHWATMLRWRWSEMTGFRYRHINLKKT